MIILNLMVVILKIMLMNYHIVLFPKFHEPKLSQRFVVSYAICTIKPLAKRLTLGLKAVYFKICSYSRMLLKVTGI